MSERTLNEIIDQRKEKIKTLVADGINPYPHNFDRSHLITEALESFDDLFEKKGTRLAGRLMSRRVMGKASFANIMDGSGKLQLYIGRDDIGVDTYMMFKQLDIGDFIGVSGELMTTRTGEKTLKVHELTLLSKNIRPLPNVKEKDGQLLVDMEDEEIRGATVVNKGEITWPPPAPRLYAVPEKKEESAAAITSTEETKDGPMKQLLFFGTVGLLLLALGSVAPPDFISHFTVFVLSCFIGYMVIWNVSPSLHTPLMSVTNAISSIIIIGALLQISSPDELNKYLAAFAILITSVNIVGGFAVTQRMLAMFRK